MKYNPFTNINNTCGDTRLQDLKGATIVNIGFHPDVREGGLTIDYIRHKEFHTRRMILGYTELGLWVDFQEDIG